MVGHIDVMFIDIWEFFDATRAQEAFEADHTVLEQWLQLFLVVRNNSAPKSNVNVKFPLGSLLLR